MGWPWWTAATLLFGGLGWLVCFGAGQQLTTHSYGGSVNIDAGSHIWYLWHLKEALLGRVDLFHSDRIFYPFGVHLIRQDWEPVVGLMALPFQAVGPLFAFNIQFLLAYLFTGLTTTLLARALGASRLAALLAGVIFAFCEYRVLKSHYHGQPGYAHQEFIPLFALMLLFYLRRGRVRHALGAGACFFLATFCTPYQMVFLLLFTLVVLAWELGAGAAGRRGPARGLAGLGSAARRSAGFSLWAGGAALLLVLPVLLLNWGPITEALQVVGVSTLRAPADLLSYVQPAIVPGVDHGRSHEESRVAFMGYGVLALAGLSLLGCAVGLGRRRRPGAGGPCGGPLAGPGVWLAAAGVFFLFSLGEQLTVGGEPVLGLPFYSTLRQLPVLRGVRMASRFASMVALCLCLAVALSLTLAGRAAPLAGRPRLRRLLEGALLLAVAAELTLPRARDLAENPDLPGPLPITPAVAHLAQQPGQFTVLTYPAVWETRTEVLGSGAYPPHRMMARQVFHGKRLVTGTGDAIPVETFRFFAQDQFFIRIMDLQQGQPVPDPRHADPYDAAALLRRLGVRYILLHRDAEPAAGEGPPPVRYHTAAALAYFRKLLRTEQVLADRQEVLLRVLPTPDTDDDGPPPWVKGAGAGGGP